MITIATPFRNRFWIYQDYLKGILSSIYYLKRIYPKSLWNIEKFHIIIIVDGSIRDISELQSKTTEITSIIWNLEDIKITFINEEIEVPEDTRQGQVRDKYIYQHLANRRNQLIDLYLKTLNNYLFFVDSDVVVHEQCFAAIIDNLKCKENLGVCSTFIANDFGQGAIGNILDFNEGSCQHIRDYDGNFRYVDITGAIMGIKRVVLESGCRFGYHPVGEDYPFCVSVQKQHYKLGCVGKLADHYMELRREEVGIV